MQFPVLNNHILLVQVIELLFDKQKLSKGAYSWKLKSRPTWFNDC